MRSGSSRWHAPHDGRRRTSIAAMIGTAESGIFVVQLPDRVLANDNPLLHARSSIDIGVNGAAGARSAFRTGAKQHRHGDHTATATIRVCRNAGSHSLASILRASASWGAASFKSRWASARLRRVTRFLLRRLLASPTFDHVSPLAAPRRYHSKADRAFRFTPTPSCSAEPSMPAASA